MMITMTRKINDGYDDYCLTVHSQGLAFWVMAQSRHDLMRPGLLGQDALRHPAYPKHRQLGTGTSAAQLKWYFRLD